MQLVHIRSFLFYELERLFAVLVVVTLSPYRAAKRHKRFLTITPCILQAGPADFNECECVPVFISAIICSISAALVVGGVILFRRRLISKLKAEFALEQQGREEKFKADLEKALKAAGDKVSFPDALYGNPGLIRISFLTELTEVMRSPLLSMLDAIGTLRQNSKKTHDQLEVQALELQHNSRRLLLMIDQLLAGKRPGFCQRSVSKRQGDIILLFSKTTHWFSNLAAQADIELSFHASAACVQMDFDHELMENTCFNLISVVFELTSGPGKVQVSVDLDGQQIEIHIRGTGPGLNPDQLVYSRLFPGEDPPGKQHQGTHLGFSIASELIKLQGGEILVDTDEGFGLCFTVCFPLREMSRGQAHESHFASKVPSSIHFDKPEIKGKKASLLLADDDADMRAFLKDNLQAEFEIIEAENGKVAWQKTLFYQPDLVLSDVAMPGLSGIELCEKIKTDARTLQIPVLLLTAMGGDQNTLNGLLRGANDYTTKPFNMDILLSKIRNLLHQQAAFKKRYHKQVEIRPQAVQIEAPDEKFIQQLIAEIEHNMENSNLTVDLLSSLLLISRVTLYKKAVALTGNTPLDLIKSFRLKRAAQLLEQRKLTVSQISYKVGFKTPRYFVKLFKAEFGVLPSKYASDQNVAE